MVKKRTYIRAFKVQALELAQSGQKSINEIERDLGITPGLLHKAMASTSRESFIEAWSNRQRRHSTLGYLSLEQFEQQSQS